MNQPTTEPRVTAAAPPKPAPTQTAESPTNPRLETKEVSLDEFREVVAAGAPGLYAILDACGSEAIQGKILELLDTDSPPVSLYKGRAEIELAEVAPYLVLVDLKLFDWITQTVWGQPWGFFILTQYKHKEIFRTLREHLLIRFSDGDTIYFRFYDPRVIEDFLQIADPQQLGRLFGCIRSILLRAPNPTSIIRHQWHREPFDAARSSDMGSCVLTDAQLNRMTEFTFFRLTSSFILNRSRHAGLKNSIKDRNDLFRIWGNVWPTVSRFSEHLAMIALIYALACRVNGLDPQVSLNSALGMKDPEFTMKMYLSLHSFLRFSDFDHYQRPSATEPVEN